MIERLQVRAAKNIDEPVQVHFESMRDLKSTYVFDNAYLSGSGHEKLTPAYAIGALEVFTLLGGMDTTDNDWSAKKFKAQICLPLRIVELWEKSKVNRLDMWRRNRRLSRGW